MKPNVTLLRRFVEYVQFFEKTYLAEGRFRPSSYASVRATLPERDFTALIRCEGAGDMPAAVPGSAASTDGPAICPMASTSTIDGAAVP